MVAQHRNIPISRRRSFPVTKTSLYIPLAVVVTVFLALHFHISATNQALHPAPGRFSSIHLPKHDPPVNPQKDSDEDEDINMGALTKSAAQKRQAKDLPLVVKQPAENGGSSPAADLSNTIAYAISLVKCGDHQTNAAGLIDAALVLRHSIHLVSSRNTKKSKYDYHMWAIVHRQAVECSHLLEKVGFKLMIVDAPVQPSEIKGDFLRKKIHKEWCCGHDEFVKWFPYKMTDYPAVVHLDIDFAFLQPMDELFDAIKYDKDSPEGQAARSKIVRERPIETLPDKIDAFFTRDWPQVVPGRVPGYQAGFIVVRPDPTVFTELTEIVRKGNYVEGFSRTNGWGGLGYGGFVGAMAMQGLMAYYYDHVRNNTSVELNQCRYNWMGMDVFYRAAPNFKRNHPKAGKCRNDLEYCEDCMKADLADIKSVHYTECRKPWNCVGVGVPGGAKGAAIDTNAGSFEKCMEVVTRWHEIRSDFESKLFTLTNDPRLTMAASHDYKKDIFQGHCAGEGGKNYTQIDASDDSFARVPEIYNVILS